MNAAPAQTLPREHWHRRAQQLAGLDCYLCELLPSNETPLSRLASEKFELLTRKLAQLVEEAAKDSRNRIAAPDIERWMASEIWNFVKTLNPHLPPFGRF